jgi:hypothetical protein
MADGSASAAQPGPLSPRQRARRALKWLAFRGAALLIVLACVEGLSFVALRVMRVLNVSVSVSDYTAGAAELERLNNPELHPLQGLGPDFDEVLHPYVGFVLTHHDPDQQDLSDVGWLQQVLYKRSKDRLIVALTGGSVAHQVYELASGRLKEELAKVPRFQGREVVIAGLCLGGYKQPQQLMILNYLLSLGGEFDVVINLDGFNEVAIHAPENGRNGVFPIFPRWWQGRVNDVADPALRALTGELAYLRKDLEGLQGWQGMGVLRYFQTGKLWRAYRVKRVHREIQRVVEEISTPSESGARRYIASGPRWQFDEEELYEHLTEIWRRTSLQMHYLSRGNGIEYYHFLQPNQYVEGSKPMGPDELRRAYDENMRYRAGAVEGYPKLIAKGQQLRASGVAFRDLTQLFVNETEPMYRDTCCHFLQPGVDALARAIAQTVRDTPAP